MSAHQQYIQRFQELSASIVARINGGDFSSEELEKLCLALKNFCDSGSIDAANAMPSGVKILDCRIDNVPGLAPKMAKRLVEAGIVTVRELASSSEQRVIKVKFFGRKSLGEVRKFLIIHGLRLGMTAEDFTKLSPTSSVGQ